MRERRVFARFPAKLPLMFLSPGRRNECPAETVDVSANGIGFICDVELLPNTPLEMWLDIPGQHEPFYMRGEVVWSCPALRKTRHRVGVRLEKAEFTGLAPILWR